MIKLYLFFNDNTIGSKTFITKIINEFDDKFIIVENYNDANFILSFGGDGTVMSASIILIVVFKLHLGLSHIL